MNKQPIYLHAVTPPSDQGLSEKGQTTLVLYEVNVLIKDTRLKQLVF